MYADSEAVGQRTDAIFGQQGDILLLLVQRDHEKIRHQCLKLTIQEGDILFVYGSRSAIEGKFHQELKKVKQAMEQEQNIVGI
jgi:Trk K+ transport system NAD-binding subunit